MFYEMITGKRPFHGDSVTTVMYKIISEQAAPLATVNRQLPPSLDPVLKKALAKSPKQRYQQCADLVRDVKKALEGAGTGTPPTPVPAAQQIAEAAPAPVAPAPAESKPERTIPSGHHAAWPHGAPPAAAAPAKVAPRPLPAPKTASKGPIIGIAAVAVVLLAAGAYWFLGRSPAEEQAAPQPVASEPAPAKRGAKKAGPAPAPTKTATKTGSLEVLIKSNVDGATISVDGKTQPGWETPRRIPISPGAHTIQVSKPGYQTKKLAMTASESGPREFTLNMTADAAAPKATAPPPEPKVSAPAETGGQGSLRVLTEPAGASIFVDGKKTPYQSPVIVPLPAGKHTIVLQHRRHEPVTREVVIEANKIGEIKVNLAAPK
jgi:serine/threonine-protein kinase